jgi:hypothetical protein
MKFWIVTVQPDGYDKRIMGDMIWHTQKAAQAYYDVVCRLYAEKHVIELHEFEV